MRHADVLAELLCQQLLLPQHKLYNLRLVFYLFYHLCVLQRLWHW